MSRKKKIIIAIVLIVVVIIVGLFVYSKKHNGTLPWNGGTFPIGGNIPETTNGTGTPDTTGTTPDGGGTGTPETNPNKRLFQVSKNAVGGFAVTYITRPIAPKTTPPVPAAEGTAGSTTTGVTTGGTTGTTSKATTTTKKTTTKVKTPPAPTTETVPAVRYAETGNGNIFETIADTMIEKRLSNMTIPRIIEAYFTDNGNNVIMRYLGDDGDTIQTYVGHLMGNIRDQEAPQENLQGGLLAQNISDVSVSPSGKNFLYLAPFGNKIATVLADQTGSNRTDIFYTSFHSWLPMWTNDQYALFVTKASAYMPGFAYTVNTQTGGMVKTLGNISGLMAKMSPDGKYLLYSRSVQNGTKLYLLNIGNGTTTDLEIGTLADKCTWTMDSSAVYCAVPIGLGSGIYPDDWYQGIMTFSDTFWRIDPKGNYINYELFTPTKEGAPEIDGINLQIDSSGKYLFFVNKKDGMLWKYDLK